LVSWKGGKLVSWKGGKVERWEVGKEINIKYTIMNNKINFYINKDKVYYAKIQEPSDGDERMGVNPHGWRLALVLGFDQEGDKICLYLEMEDKESCEDFISGLGLLKCESKGVSMNEYWS
jgi:hypothetical protein